MSHSEDWEFFSMAKISQKLVSCLSVGVSVWEWGSDCPGMGEAKPAMVKELCGSPLPVKVLKL